MHYGVEEHRELAVVLPSVARVGGEKDIAVNVRVFAATNKDLKKEISENRFREDLYHRLGVIIIKVPSLDERKEDIRDLVEKFLGVIAEREFQAINAMHTLAGTAVWIETAVLPDEDALPAAITALPGEVHVILDRNAPSAPATASLEATYTKPYTLHGSIGPSCAVAVSEGNGLTVWSHTQGVFPDRAAIAEMLRMPKEKVRVIHTEGSGQGRLALSAVHRLQIGEPKKESRRSHFHSRKRHLGQELHGARSEARRSD